MPIRFETEIPDPEMYSKEILVKCTEIPHRTRKEVFLMLFW